MPSERAQQAYIGELDVIGYQAGADDGSEKSPSEKAQSEKAPSVKAPSERAPSERAPSEKAPSSEKGSVKAASSIRGKSPTKSVAASSIQEEADRVEVKSMAGKSVVSFKEEPVEQQDDDFEKALASLERVGWFFYFSKTYL